MDNRLIDPTRWTWDYDWLVLGRIERDLGRYPQLSMKVDVIDKNPVATMTGTVPAAKVARLAEEIVLINGANGALDVNNHIAVDQERSGSQRPPF